ncbi:ferric enterobactin transporter FepD [Azorhizobium oxalatiphilum]|uniref:Ferric enterobactin transporter FepD n=1 Tax=Azorhizobium oxalatiphilum TaxID=980631 RepID=A0A917FFU4_9HYPH|nr:iron ABC transporter permease [Azorhizobium oxalatiphilum]GGF75148.1 ferric enterobactin transporter FepD [Azorhizobium oxalatiphilum]
MRPALALPLAAGGLLALCALHLCVGARPLSPAIVLDALTAYDPQDYRHVVVVRQRLTRLVVALGVGGMLAVAGYVLQKVLRNDLASPSTLGINAGAAAFCVLGLYLFGLSGTALFWPALLGAVSSLACTFAAAGLVGRGSRDPINLVLGGAMSGTLFSAAATFVMSLDPDRFGDVLGWLVGDIGLFDYQSLLTLWPAGLLAVGLLLMLARPLDLIALGAEQAASLGVDPRNAQRLALAACVLLAVLAVTIAGPIGFVGLVAPHVVKLLVGETGAWPIALSGLTGSAMVTGADILARLLLAPRLVNVGTVLALFGGLAFLGLVLIVLRRRAA